MPTFKHPCPYCGKFIDKTVRACPFCSQMDPFAPKRCLACRKVVEDQDWTTCPSCGASLIAPPPPPPGAATTATPAAASAAPAASPSGAAPATGPAEGEPAIDPAVTKLDEPPPPRPPLYQDPNPAVQAMKSAGPCSGCGAPLPAGARFCTICGTVAAS
jgi:hypothetical protein